MSRGRETTESPTGIGLLKVYAALCAFLSAVEVVRLMAIYNTAELNKVGLFIIGIPALLYMVHQVSGSRPRVCQLALWMLVLLLSGIFFGLLYGNDLRHLLSDTLTVLFSIATLILFSSQRFSPRQIGSFLSFASWWLLVGNMISIAAGYIAVFIYHQRIYFSFGGFDLLLPLSYFLVYRRWTLAACAIATVLVGGKVGVVLGAGLLGLLYLCTLLRLPFLAVGTLFLLLTAGLVAAAALSVDLETISFGPVAEGVITKLRSYNPMKLMDMSRDEVLNFGGGRVAELYYSWNKLMSYPGVPLLTGGGFGFSYDMMYRDELFENVHNAHVSLATLVLRHGIILTGILCLLMIRFFRKAYLHVYISGADSAYQVLFLFLWGSFFFSFTAFNIFVCLFNWAFIGMLIAKQQGSSISSTKA